MSTTTIYNNVKSYTGTNNFMNSLKKQLNKKGELSPRQIECAERFFAPEQKPVAINYSFNKGQEITIRKWLAQSLATKRNMPFFFRNLIVEEVLNETNRAVEVKVRFDSKIATCCHLCGRGLDHEVSKATGIGPVCAKKYLKVKRPTLQNSKEIIAKIEEEAKNAGVIGPLWIPKSQIVSKAQQVLFGDE